MTDYFDVLEVLDKQKHVYFSSSKSEIIELCNWLDKHDTNWKNPFQNPATQTRTNHVTHLSSYTDIMVY